MINRVQLVGVVKEPIEISCRKTTLAGYKIETQRANGQRDLVMVTGEQTLEVGKCYKVVGELHSLWACVNDTYNVFVVVKEATETTEDRVTEGCQVVLEGTLIDKARMEEFDGKRCVEIRVKQQWEGRSTLPLVTVKCWYEAADTALATPDRSLVRINGFLFSKKRRVGDTNLPLIFVSSNTVTVLKAGDSTIRERVVYAVGKQELQLTFSLLKQVRLGQERVTRISNQRLEAVKRLEQMGFVGKLKGVLADPDVRDEVVDQLVGWLERKQNNKPQGTERFSESLLHAWALVLSWNEYKDVRSEAFEQRVVEELTKAVEPDWETSSTFSPATGKSLDKQS